MPCDITGVTWEALGNSHGIQWPYPEGRKEELSGEQRRLYEDGNFFTPSKKAQFVFEEYRPWKRWTVAYPEPDQRSEVRGGCIGEKGIPVYECRVG